jgi:hypothetical protein
MKILDDAAIKNLNKILKQIRDALDTIEKGITMEDEMNQFRAADIIISLGKTVSAMIELQTDSIKHTVKLLNLKYGLGITEVH